MLRFIAARDHGLMRWLHRWQAPGWVRLWMVAATRGGDGWLWYAVLACVLLLGGETRLAAFAAGSLAALAGIVVFQVLKRSTGRKRPCEIEPHCWAQLVPPDQFSFPSGHSITAFAVAVALGLFYPMVRAPLLFCAGSVAASRVVLGMHFLSDVVAGSVLGAALGFAAFAVFG